MKVLVIGSGGREHTICWKLAQSPLLERMFVAPGNGGTAGLTDSRVVVSNVSLDIQQPQQVLEFVHKEGIDLTVVGPEAPLVEGLSDVLQRDGRRCFGPSRAAVQLEASKAFAKDFMSRQQIATARYQVFTDCDRARAYVERADHSVVIKASGLAAGKGVLLPETKQQALDALDEVFRQRIFGTAGDRVVIEERLRGPEVSLLAFCDGNRVAVMPPAQDHKRIFDGDRGPNTGGMGAYAPAPVLTPELLQKTAEQVLQTTVSAMAAEGNPYVGVLYAGLILTEQGPQVLEFNCRFGDPECQVLLPLLQSDLLPVLEACVEGRLDQVQLNWHNKAAATVVAASEGYPGDYTKGWEIRGLAQAEEQTGVLVFHAGTAIGQDGSVVSSGGRVLAITALGEDLQQAVDRAYGGLGCIEFNGKTYRRDIAAQALKTTAAGV